MSIKIMSKPAQQKQKYGQDDPTLLETIGHGEDAHSDDAIRQGHHVGHHFGGFPFSKFS